MLFPVGREFIFLAKEFCSDYCNADLRKYDKAENKKYGKPVTAIIVDYESIRARYLLLGAGGDFLLTVVTFTFSALRYSSQ